LNTLKGLMMSNKVFNPKITKIKYTWSNFQNKWNDNLQPDKQYHFKWGWLIMFIITIANEMTIKLSTSALIIITAIMGLGVNDAYATISGGVAGIVLATSLVIIGREVVGWFL